MSVKTYNARISLKSNPHWLKGKFDVDVAIPFESDVDSRTVAQLVEYVTHFVMKERDALDKHVETADDVIKSLDKTMAKAYHEGFFDASAAVYIMALRQQNSIIDKTRDLLKKCEAEMLRDVPKMPIEFWERRKSDKSASRHLKFKAVVRVGASLFSSAAVLGGVLTGVFLGPPGWAAGVVGVMAAGAFLNDSIKALLTLGTTETKMRAAIASQMVVVKGEIVKAQRAAISGKDPGFKDKVKSIFKTNEVKKLAGMLEGHRLKLVEIDRGISRTAGGLDKFLDEQEKLLALVTQGTKTAQEVKSELKKVRTATDSLLKELDLVNGDLKEGIDENKAARRMLASLANGEIPDAKGAYEKASGAWGTLNTVYVTAKGIYKILTPFFAKYK